MDTTQRNRPGTEQRTPRPKTARKTTDSRTDKAEAAPQRKRSTTRKVQRQQERISTSRTRKRATQTKPKQRRPAPQVVYTPPKPFSRNRLLLRLATMVAVVLALTFGISIFFKVATVTVSGMEKYTAWDVREASGIQEGDNLLTFGETRARARILAELPYVESVRIGIKLPDTVNIEIKEFDVLYAIRDQSSNWWLITSGGSVVEQVDSATAGQYTEILGVVLSLPKAGEQAVAMEAVSVAGDLSDGTDDANQAVAAPVTVLESERLDTALQILQYLEANGVIGKIASVDVTDLSQLEMWYGQQYQVELGDTTQLNYKISCMKETVNELGNYQSGVLDVSFTIWPEWVGYTPFT